MNFCSEIPWIVFKHIFNGFKNKQINLVFKDCLYMYMYYDSNIVNF